MTTETFEEAAAALDATPETDALYAKHHPAQAMPDINQSYATFVKFSRTLERQRNALRDKLVEAERDAKRYRWLRSIDVQKGDVLPNDFWNQLGDTVDADFDAAIDAAMSEREGS